MMKWHRSAADAAAAARWSRSATARATSPSTPAALAQWWGNYPFREDEEFAPHHNARRPAAAVRPSRTPRGGIPAARAAVPRARRWRARTPARPKGSYLLPALRLPAQGGRQEPLGGAVRGGEKVGSFGIPWRASRRANPRLAPRARPHAARGPGARTGQMEREVGQAFQRHWRPVGGNGGGGAVLKETFARRSGPHAARAPGVQMIRMPAGRSPAFQQVSWDSIYAILSIRRGFARRDAPRKIPKIPDPPPRTAPPIRPSTDLCPPPCALCAVTQGRRPALRDGRECVTAQDAQGGGHRSVDGRMGDAEGADGTGGWSSFPTTVSGHILLPSWRPVGGNGVQARGFKRNAFFFWHFDRGIT
eukprot:gene22962-biopygen14830